MPSAAPALTPMFRQFRALKNDHPNAILLFRMGDFYEMFFDDAAVASRALELTLTVRGRGTDTAAPMCGFPHPQLDAYVARLVREGHRVAICEQVEDPRAARGLVRREVVRVVTPGTVTDPAQLDASDNAWIGAVALDARRLGLALADLTTGELLAWESREASPPEWDALADRLRAFAPRELVVPEGFAWDERFARERTSNAVLTPYDAHAFAPAAAAVGLARQLGVLALDGFGLRDRPAAVAAAGGLVQYLRDTQRSGLEHLNGLRLHDPAEFLVLDPATRRNLDLERSARDGSRAGSLLHALDRTLTAAGGRLWRRWLVAPLLDPLAIESRQDAVAELVARPALRDEVRDALHGILDLERLFARAVGGTATPRDLAAIRASLERLPALARALAAASATLVSQALDEIDPCDDLVDLLSRALVDAPPLGLRDGGVIRDGYHAELDEYRSIQRDGRAYIAALEAREREATRIASLKVRYNKVFGYYLEVSKSNLHLVPERYERRQTIVGGERFVTPELKEHESKVLRAQDRIAELELELFAALRAEIVRQVARLKRTSCAIARIDVLAGLAEVAVAHDYRRPRVVLGTALAIRGGRHPVVERLAGERFVPNDTTLDAPGRSIAVLTGPNMGGKSTYLRQVGLIAVLAQAGSFVPADEATIGIVDRVFCRVGAADNLAEGQSTFLVEMSETANILHHATSRSLVLLDEIGRGTSTFDGLSIAWSVVEHLAREPAAAPRTLFATHYHELTELAAELESVKNLRMAVRERGEQVVFLHRVEEGAADRSYGIHVARLAGIPPRVVERAREILANLERDEYGKDGLPRRARRGPRPGGAEQPSLFRSDAEERRDPVAADVLAELRGTDLDRIAPIEALTLVAAWQRRLNAGES
jgi:DNA mismatch repair protein MutS